MFLYLRRSMTFAQLNSGGGFSGTENAPAWTTPRHY